MREGIQSNFEHEELRHFGCYFFVLLRWAEILKQENTPNFEYSDDVIITLFNLFKEKGWIGNNSFIVNPVAIINYLQKNKIFRTIYISKIKPSVPLFPIYLKKPSIGHFVLANQNGIFWDSWSPKANLHEFPIDSYRVIE